SLAIKGERPLIPVWLIHHHRGNDARGDGSKRHSVATIAEGEDEVRIETRMRANVREAVFRLPERPSPRICGVDRYAREETTRLVDQPLGFGWKSRIAVQGI